jgi:hypothetical protein
MRALPAHIFGVVALGCTSMLAEQGSTAPGTRIQAVPPPSPCADTRAVIARAVTYVAHFGAALGSIVATEDYRQELVGMAEPAGFTPPPIAISPGIEVRPAAPMTVRAGQRQTLRSSFLFVRLPDEQAWIGFRDVLEVNGRRVGSGARGSAPIEKPGESSLDRWRRLSEESARYNIGSITRTLNVPTFALLVLHPDNPERFAFTPATGDPTPAPGTCEVAFQEVASPTIVRSGVGGDMPTSGTFRLDAATGRVARSELIAGSSSAGVALRATVLYDYDKRLQLWLPREMREEYLAQSGERLNCVARYSNYMRTEVTATVRPGEP